MTKIQVDFRPQGEFRVPEIGDYYYGLLNENIWLKLAAAKAVVVANLKSPDKCVSVYRVGDVSDKPITDKRFVLSNIRMILEE